MRVRVRLFAQLRERAGADHLDLDLPDGATVGEAISAAGALVAGLPVVMAVNRGYAGPDVVLQPGDELALVPPVSGGSARVHARVETDPTRPLSVDALLELVRDPRAGAVVTFSGVTRDVSHLDYEVYAEMAAEEIGRIVEAAAGRHGLCAAACEHRVGRVPLGEASVVVAASAPHRAEAFAGAREIIDQVKARVPVFKKEEGAWVQGNRPAVLE